MDIHDNTQNIVCKMQKFPMNFYGTRHRISTRCSISMRRDVGFTDIRNLIVYTGM